MSSSEWSEGALRGEMIPIFGVCFEQLIAKAGVAVLCEHKRVPLCLPLLDIAAEQGTALLITGRYFNVVHSS